MLSATEFLLAAQLSPTVSAKAGSLLLGDGSEPLNG